MGLFVLTMAAAPDLCSGIEPRHRQCHVARLAVSLVVLVLATACVVPTVYRPATAALSYRVVATWPHDPGAFTEGLVWAAGELYESVGLEGQSELRRVDLGTGAVRQRHVLASELFGEGLTLHGDRLIQLTWRSHVGFVYDRGSFRALRQFTYPTEGWGLASDGTRLIMSDGTATLHLLDPDQLRETGTLVVTDQGVRVHNLNELEVVGHVLYANVWHSDHIARIDLASGQVTAWIDLTGILGIEQPADHEAVLNGIAYDAAHDRLLVTGKRWPKLFAIEIIDGAGRPVAPGAP